MVKKSNNNEKVAEKDEEVVQADEDTVAENDSESSDDFNNSQLESLKTESEKNLAGWQRTLAEFQNYKKRVEREQKELRQRVELDTITRMLAIIDDFERATENVPESFKDDPWLNGITLIQGKFKKLLDDYDVTEIDPVGEEFDPNNHQAISMADSDEYESGHVIETLQKGYRSADILLRPAMVRVAN